MSAPRTVRVELAVPCVTEQGRSLGVWRHKFDVTLPADAGQVVKVPLCLHARGREYRRSLALNTEGLDEGNSITFACTLAPVVVPPDEIEEVEVIRGPDGEIASTRRLRYLTGVAAAPAPATGRRRRS